MTRKLNNVKLFSVFIALSIFTSACSGGFSAKQGRTSRTIATNSDFTSGQVVWRPTMQNDIPVTMNADVQRWVGLFQGRFKQNFDRWIGRIGTYGPTIEHILKEEGVPKDLIYLAMIESGFNLSATSVAACVGPWQFSRGTGRAYGLQNDFFMDDRRDLVNATRAAARHLKDLYQTYGDWYLAFAAYNAGPGTVNKAIRGTGSNDYWKHAKSRFLRQETKDYVPKILAALHIVKNYTKFGYSTQSFSHPMKYDRVTVPDATDVATLAKSAGTTVDVIQELNPALVSGITRPGQQVSVFLPQGAKEGFQRRYASIPPDERVSGLYHKVGRRENLNTLAKQYGVGRDRIAKLNNISANQPLKPGQVIRVPADRKSLMALANRNLGSTRGSWATHRVRRGETLNAIARRYNTNTKNLASWNRLGMRSQLRIGQKLKIYQASKQPSFGGAFYATGLPSASNRMSGVNHIITQDQKAPVTVAMTKNEASDILPKMVAVADNEQLLNADQPSVVRTVENTPLPTEEPDQRYNSKLTQPKLAQKPVAKPLAVAANTTHVVRPGDTLGKIAMTYHVPVSHIRQLNSLRSDVLRPNQKLVVKKGGSAPVQSPRVANRYAAIPAANKAPVARTALNNRRATPSEIVHQTRSGDTLWKISKRYGVKIADIKKWNRLNGDSLKPNQRIKIISTGGKNVALVKS